MSVLEGGSQLGCPENALRVWGGGEGYEARTATLSPDMRGHCQGEAAELECQHVRVSARVTTEGWGDERLR